MVPEDASTLAVIRDADKVVRMNTARRHFVDRATSAKRDC